jgi:LacI family transcriptional regulator
MTPRDWTVDRQSESPPVRKRATIRDVAALARVGLKTVSRVMNGEPGVSDELTQRVQRAAVQLDYLPNLAAGQLRRSGGRTGTLGVILENVANPFSSMLYRAIEDAAAARGVDVYSGSTEEDPRRERRLVATFAARRVDGLAVMPASHDHGYLLAHRHAGMALVFMDRPSEHLDADTVTSDNRAGSAGAVAHLLAIGHRRIAYLGDLGTVHTAQERHAGYLEALGAAGVTADPALVCQDLQDSLAAEATASRLLAEPNPPTAIYASQNLVTIGAIRALRNAQLQHRVALIGFDDVVLADLLDPPVTVVAQDPRRIGTVAAEILFGRLGGDTGPSRHEIVQTRLIARGSGEIPPRL